jgi:XTP/dITP diphosphohydrolase
MTVLNTIVFASTNKGKIKEMNALLEGTGIALLSLSDIGFAHAIEETGTTFEENARIKAQAVCSFSGLPSFSDDSGLIIDALDGAPGVYSARFLGEDTPYTIKNRMIIEKLEGVSPENRTARYACAVCCVFPEGGEIVAHGACEGTIGYEQRGTNGFGYDPIFYMGERSLAELSDDEKNAVSHRGQAVRTFVHHLRELNSESTIQE